MKGRIYHIGLPKTGTTSIQRLVHDWDIFLGVRQPRDRTTQLQVFDDLTKFLLGLIEAPPKKMPEKFFYSEEMILVNSIDGMAKSNVERLLSILRPQDVVIITTRELRSLRTSAYYEFFRFFKDMPLEQVKNHPLMLPFCDQFIRNLFSRHMDQVYFSRLEDNHSVLSEKLGLDLISGLKSMRENHRKAGSRGVLVEIEAPVIPAQLHFFDALINPITWRISKKWPQNFFARKTKSQFIEISRLNERDVAIICEGASEFSH